MLKLAEKLFKLLHDREISYCLFIETQELEKGLEQGKGYLEILIAEVEITKAEEAITSSGFKKVIGYRSSKDIILFVGLDIITGKCLILHVFSKLRLGDPKSKELRWAIEDRIMDNKVYDDIFGVYIIHPEDMLYVLVVRMILKNEMKEEDLIKLGILKRQAYSRGC